MKKVGINSVQETKVYSIEVENFLDGDIYTLDLYTSKKEAKKVLLEEFKKQIIEIDQKETDKENSILIDGITINDSDIETDACFDSNFEYRLLELTLHSAQKILVDESDEAKLDQDIEKIKKEILVFNTKPVIKKQKKTIQKVYKVLNDDFETISVQKTLKSAKAFLKQHDEGKIIEAVEFAIDSGKKNADFYGITLALLEGDDQFGDWLFSNKKQARKMYETLLLDFKDNLDEETEYSETENEIRADGSYLVLSHYQIEL